MTAAELEILSVRINLAPFAFISDNERAALCTLIGLDANCRAAVAKRLRMDAAAHYEAGNMKKGNIVSAIAADIAI